MYERNEPGQLHIDSLCRLDNAFASRWGGGVPFSALDIGGLTVFVNYSRQFSRPINELAQQVTNIMSALAGAERVFNVMDETEEIDDGKNLYLIKYTVTSWLRV